jgi:hypothetical protein
MSNTLGGIDTLFSFASYSLNDGVPAGVQGVLSNDGSNYILTQYIADIVNSCITKIESNITLSAPIIFTITGYSSQWASGNPNGLGTDGISGPTALAYNATTSHLYIVNNQGNNHWVSRVNTSDGSFDDPHYYVIGEKNDNIYKSIALDDRTLFMVDTINSKIIQVNINDANISVIIDTHQANSHPVGICYDADEHLLYTTDLNGYITQYAVTYADSNSLTSATVSFNAEYQVPGSAGNLGTITFCKWTLGRNANQPLLIFCNNGNLSKINFTNTSAPTLLTGGAGGGNFSYIANYVLNGHKGMVLPEYVSYFGYDTTVVFVSGTTSKTVSGIDVDYPIYTDASCFLSGTRIRCIQGDVLIEDLKEGDLVATVSHGYVPVHTVVSQPSFYHAANHEQRIMNQLYQYHDDLVVTGCHSLLIPELSEEQRATLMQLLGDIYVTDGLYRYPACLSPEASVFATPGFYTIYHFALEHDNELMNYGVFANDVLVESCSKRMAQLSSGLGTPCPCPSLKEKISLSN